MSRDPDKDKKVRIGCGAGFSGDRIEPAEDLARLGNLHYLVFECLAERTIALAQLRKLENSNEGYDPFLRERFERIIPLCAENKTRIITNMGAANPLSAGKITLKILKKLGLEHLKIGIVTGDDILSVLEASSFSIVKISEDISEIREKNISANAYLGASPIIGLLGTGADIIITGRTCDSSLFLAPMMYEFGIKGNEWGRIGQGIAVSHLMECGTQVSGGYFADPGRKDVADLGSVGYPIIEVDENLDAVITKLPEAGGEVSLRTVKEQLLYEVHDPRSYITADGISDFTKVKLEQVGKDRVRVYGGGGSASPLDLKISIGFRNGFIGEAQISYGGSGASQRAQLAAQVVLSRLKERKLDFKDLRIDLMGSGSLGFDSSPSREPREIRMRVVGRAQNRLHAQKLCSEVEALYTNGPAGGGGVTKSVEESIGILSAFISRDEVKPSIMIMEDEHEED